MSAMGQKLTFARCRLSIWIGRAVWRAVSAAGPPLSRNQLRWPMPFRAQYFCPARGPFGISMSTTTNLQRLQKYLLEDNGRRVDFGEYVFRLTDLPNKVRLRL